MYDLQKLKHVDDLIWYDGPLLSHMIINIDHFLISFVDIVNDKWLWLLFPISYSDLQKFKNSEKTLYLLEKKATGLYIIEQNDDGNFKLIKTSFFEDLPKDYIPDKDSYI